MTADEERDEAVHARVLAAILASIDEYNALQTEGDRCLTASPETVLFGPSGGLDSLGLVNLIVATEQRVEEVFGVGITLADSHAVSMERSPFRTVGTFADYVTHRLTGEVS